MRDGSTRENWKVVPLAADPAAVLITEDTPGVSLSDPAIEALPGGRVVLAVNQLGPGVKNLPGRKGHNPHFKHQHQGRVFTSNDGGRTWTFRATFPFGGARLLRDGSTLYLLGDNGSLEIASSLNGGQTWTEPDHLTSRVEAQCCYVHTPTEAARAGGYLRVPAMRITDLGCRGGFDHVHAAVVLRAREGSNLSQAKNWTFSEPVVPFREFATAQDGGGFGIPFYRLASPVRGEAVAHQRWAGHIGWHDPHLVQIRDPAHYWHDPSGRTFHLLAAAATHRSNVAALAKVVEEADGRMTLMPETTPAGNRVVFLPLPGGNLKFHIVYDEPSNLFWLISHQVADSMTRAERLPPHRQGLPCDEDGRLQLHFSRNLVDWRFAGLVAAAADAGGFNAHPTMAVKGGDLHVAWLAGHSAHGAHHPTRLMFSVIAGFRDLAYG